MSYVKGLKDAKAAYIKLKQALSDAKDRLEAALI